MLYQIFQVDAWGNKEYGYTYNESFFLFEIKSNATNLKRVFRKILNDKGIRFSLPTIIKEDNEILEICDKRTERPLFMMECVE